MLRAIPSNERQTAGSQQQQNYRTFGNLQWRRVVKSSIESILVSLRNETGHLIPFLSRGRTNLTLHFRSGLINEINYLSPSKSSSSFLLKTAQGSSRTKCRLHNNMDAHYDFQIRQQHQQSTFHGPARQFGSGGMGAFAMRMGRVAMPLMKKYILPVAKELGRNLVSSFLPEFTSIVSGKKRPRKAVTDVLKKSATKTIMDATQECDSVARGNEAGGGGAGGAAVIRCAEGRRGRTPGHGRAKVIAANKSNKVKSRNSVSGPSASRKVILKKSPAKRSRSDILSKVNFS